MKRLTRLAVALAMLAIVLSATAPTIASVMRTVQPLGLFAIGVWIVWRFTRRY